MATATTPNYRFKEMALATGHTGYSFVKPRVHSWTPRTYEVLVPLSERTRREEAKKDTGGWFKWLLLGAIFSD